MDEFYLRTFRENKLNWTQVQLAEQMGVTQDVISRIENGSRTITLDFLLKLCEVSGMTPDEVLEFKLSQPEVLEVPDLYADLTARLNQLEDYINPRYKEFVRDKFDSTSLQKIEEIYDILRSHSSKPLIAFMGPSDAGKSRMINALTGIDRLLKSEWTPTTAVTVYIKHVNDRPEWMDEAVWVFKSENETTGWNFRRFYDESYCRTLKIGGGSLDVLEDYCNRDSREYTKDVDSAIVYVDAPVLQLCDIADLPGFGTESLIDTIYSQRAREQADAIVFLCQSNGFFNKHEDVLFLKEIIHRLPTIHLSVDAPVLSNLFVVASQAKFVGESNIPQVLERGYSTISNQVSEALVRQHFRVEPQEFYPVLRNRFFTYATEGDAEGLRRDFEFQFVHLIHDIFPPIRNKALSQAICDFKEQTQKFFEQRAASYENMFRDIEAAKQEADRLERDKYAKFNDLRFAKSEVLKELERHLKQNRSEFREWEQKEINPKRIEKIIGDKKYSRKDAQQFLVSNVSDLYYAKLQALLEQSMVEFNETMKCFFEEMEKSLVEPTQIEAGTLLSIPFDFKGALAGALVGGGVLGWLGIMAAAAGNLGGYILVAQAVGLLGAMVGVGGGAAAVGAVAAIGGPVVIGIGIALGTLFAVKAIVGDGWKERLSKKVFEVIHRENLLDKYIDSIEQFWSDTRVEIERTVDSLFTQYETYIKIQHDTVASQNKEDIVLLNEKAKIMRNFFASLPWTCSDYDET